MQQRSHTWGKKLTFVQVRNPRVQYTLYYSMFLRAEILCSTNLFPCYPAKDVRMHQNFLRCHPGKYCSIPEETVLVALVDNLHLNDGKTHTCLFATPTGLIISLCYGIPQSQSYRHITCTIPSKCKTLRRNHSQSRSRLSSIHQLYIFLPK